MLIQKVWKNLSNRRKSFVFEVPDRSTQKLTSIIRKHALAESMIATYCWK